MTYVWFTVPTELAETLTAIVDEYNMMDDASDKARLVRNLNSVLGDYA